MSEQLIKSVRDAVIKKGVKALAEETGLSVGSIRGIAAGRQRPQVSSIYRLALACGHTESEALALARECFEREAKGAA